MKKKPLSNLQTVLIVIGGVILGCLLLIGIKLIEIKIEENKYKEKAETFLENKYNEDFILEKFYFGYQRRKISVPPSGSCECGRDRNVEAYCFVAHPKDKEIYSYVTVWYNKKSKEESIEEVDAKTSRTPEYSYEDMKEAYAIREAAIKQIEPYLEKEDKLYVVEKRTDEVVIEVKKNFVYEYIKDSSYKKELLDKIEELIESESLMGISLEIKFKGCTIRKYQESDVLYLWNANISENRTFEEACEFLDILKCIKSEVQIEDYAFTGGYCYIEIKGVMTQEIKDSILKKIENDGTVDKSFFDRRCMELRFSEGTEECYFDYKEGILSLIDREKIEE